MSKATTFFILSLLFFSLCSATRTGPAVRVNQEARNQVKAEGAQVEESCNGITEDECLMRRTLAAHLDYIYTQKHKP